MTTKSLLALAVFAASSLTAASAKSWNIYVDDSVAVGQVVLPAGNHGRPATNLFPL